MKVKFNFELEGQQAEDILEVFNFFIAQLDRQGKALGTSSHNTDEKVLIKRKTNRILTIKSKVFNGSRWEI